MISMELMGYVLQNGGGVWDGAKNVGFGVFTKDAA